MTKSSLVWRLGEFARQQSALEALSAVHSVKAPEAFGKDTQTMQREQVAVKKTTKQQGSIRILAYCIYSPKNHSPTTCSNMHNERVDFHF